MSDEKTKVTDRASEIAKSIWLAGVGAYGKAVDEAQDTLKKATPQSPKLFRDLVKAGAALEEEASEAKAAAKSSVEDRIARVRDNFQMQRLARSEDLDSLHKKLDKLTRKVDALSKSLQEGQSPNKSAAKKTPPRKTPSKTSTAAKKSPTKKPAAKAKSPARKRQA